MRAKLGLAAGLDRDVVVAMSTTVSETDSTAVLPSPILHILKRLRNPENESENGGGEKRWQIRNDFRAKTEPV